MDDSSVGEDDSSIDSNTSMEMMMMTRRQIFGRRQKGKGKEDERPPE